MAGGAVVVSVLHRAVGRFRHNKGRHHRHRLWLWLWLWFGFWFGGILNIVVDILVSRAKVGQAHVLLVHFFQEGAKVKVERLFEVLEVEYDTGFAQDTFFDDPPEGDGRQAVVSARGVGAAAHVRMAACKVNTVSDVVSDVNHAAPAYLRTRPPRRLQSLCWEGHRSTRLGWRRVVSPRARECPRRAPVRDRG